MRVSTPNAKKRRTWKTAGLHQQQKVETNMTYSTVLAARTTDLETFVTAWHDWGRDRVMEQGQLGSSLSQVMLGGERSGEVNVSFQWDSIDQAMDGLAAANSDNEIMSLYQSCGFTVQRRSLARTITERGSRDGKYVSTVMFTADPTDDETASANIDTMWGMLSAGSNGCVWAQVVAGGQFTGMYAMINWVDSLDAYMEAANTANSSEAGQKIQSDHNLQGTSRSFARSL
jgi:hypothetical protein